MSANFYAYVIHGYPFETDDLVVRTPNPLWGKSKFDPETGQKVEQYLEEDIDLESVVSKIRPQSTKIRVVGTTCDKNFGNTKIVGFLLADIEVGGNDLAALSLEVTPEIRAMVADYIEKLCVKIGMRPTDFDPKKLRTYLVGYCSY